MKFSWSMLQAALACATRWDFIYRQNLERKPSQESRLRLRGTLFHAGMAGALHASVAGKAPTYHALVAVNEAAEAEQLKWISEADYCEMVRDVAQEVHGLLMYYVPLLKLGERYDVLWRDENTPLIEYDFELANGFSGRIDAILNDKQTNTALLVDWKLRSSFGDTSLAALDGQAYAYAYALSELGIEVDEVALIEFRAKLPSRASMQISKGVPTGLPNTGAASYDTTWEQWAADVRSYGTNPEKYRAEIEPKLKTEADFWRIVQGVVNEATLLNTKQTLEAAQAQLEFYAGRESLPAAYSSHACAYCDFKQLCELRRYGYDTSFSIKKDYVNRHEIQLADTE